jgi:DNA-binding LytR/AlgR family response regulator
MNTPSSPTAVIADDEPHLARQLGDLLGRLWPELQIVATARNGVDAAAAIAQAQPTLAFLDIRMPGLTGLEVAQGIEGETRVVFVTAYDEFAVQAFEQEALDYILKPIGEARLTRTVERLKRALAAAN